MGLPTTWRVGNATTTWVDWWNGVDSRCSSQSTHRWETSKLTSLWTHHEHRPPLLPRWDWGVGTEGRSPAGRRKIQEALEIHRYQPSLYVQRRMGTRWPHHPGSPVIWPTKSCGGLAFFTVNKATRGMWPKRMTPRDENIASCIDASVHYMQ